MNIQTGSINLGAIKNLRTHITKEYIEWHYGICDADFDEGTKAIRFQINEDWTLYEGAVMAVKFIYGNKILNPKIDIQDGNGPKEVKNLIGEDPIAEWGIGAIVTFVYDGTYWRIQESYLREQMLHDEIMKNFILNKMEDIVSSNIANAVYASPSGTGGECLFRKLTVADLPTGTNESSVALGNHTHSLSIRTSERTVVDDIARTAGEDFTITIPIAAPDDSLCLGVAGVSATKSTEDIESKPYILTGFDFTESETGISVLTKWRALDTTNANDITISAKGRFINIL